MLSDLNTKLSLLLANDLLLPLLGAGSVFLFMMLFISTGAEKRLFEHRVRKLTELEERTLPDDEEIRNAHSFVVWVQAFLATIQKYVTGRFSEDSPSVLEQRRLFLSAGYRHKRAPIYFEVGRWFFAIFATATMFYVLVAGVVGSLNIAMILSLSVLVFLLALSLPKYYLKQRVKARVQQFSQFWDDAIGLLIISLDAGLSVEVAMRRIARELAVSAPVVAEELLITVADLSFLQERRIAYLNLANRMDLPNVKSVTIALIQAEKQGASIANSLRTIVQSNRLTRINRAEEKAAALGPKMTVPMIVFFLPVVFAIILAPVIIKQLG